MHANTLYTARSHVHTLLKSSPTSVEPMTAGVGGAGVTTLLVPVCGVLREPGNLDDPDDLGVLKLEGVAEELELEVGPTLLVRFEMYLAFLPSVLTLPL